MLAFIPPILSSSQLRLGTFNVGLGFQRKLPQILNRCHDLSLDIVALQEVGDPALPNNNKLKEYTFIYSAGPSQHQAGVGLLISHELMPLCRAYHKSTTGRLIGVILELSKGRRTLIISAYMPSGLDHKSAIDPIRKDAANLYQEIDGWLNQPDLIHETIVLGDLNETLTQYDRFPIPLSAPILSKEINYLILNHFIDVYRTLHHDSSSSPGFTHEVDGAMRLTCSRIDYIWTHDIPSSSHININIDTNLHQHGLSHHSMLWMTLQLHTPLPPPTNVPIIRQRIPNMRAATEKHHTAFGNRLERDWIHATASLASPHHTNVNDALSLFASNLTSVVRQAASSTLPITGAAPLRNKSILRLESIRRDLTGLLNFSHELQSKQIPLIHCIKWMSTYNHCMHHHNIKWHTVIQYEDEQRWMQETRRIICRIRAAIKFEKKQLTRTRRAPVDTNPAAAIHRMLRNDALPPQLFSVINNQDELTRTPMELQDTSACKLMEGE